MTARQVVELFHLIFVRALYANLGDKRLLAIKDGINLRFFFKSVRFSEDLDLDVMTMSKETLENRIDRLLQGPTVMLPLRSRGIEIADVSKPNQTDTVQRWKLEVLGTSSSVRDRTKIEFSRRDEIESALLEPIEREIVVAHQLPIFLATHYPCAQAVRQKVHALAERSETQPRDVFDLHVLLGRTDAPTEFDDEAKTWLEAAVSNATTLTYEQYKSLVVAYLDPEQAELYSSEEAWDTMQLDVIDRLEKLR